MLKNCNPPPPRKKSLPLFQQPPSKNGVPVKLPLFENLVGVSTLPPSSRKGGGGAHCVFSSISNYHFSFKHNEHSIALVLRCSQQQQPFLVSLKGHRENVVIFFSCLYSFFKACVCYFLLNFYFFTK